MKITPRSQWPKGTSSINAWHLDKNLTPLFKAIDEISSKFPAASAANTLPDDVINELANIAATTESIYLATAALDRIFDAYESLPVAIDALEKIYSGIQTKKRKRVIGCIGYLTRQGENRRPIIGKSGTQVEADYQHFKALHRRYEMLVESSNNSLQARRP